MRHLFALSLLFLVNIAAAQTVAFVGERGGGCVDVTSGNPSHVVSITNTVSSGNFLVVAAATGSNITFVSAVDSGGNTYTSDNSIAPSLRAFTLSAPVTTSMSGGDTLTITYNNIVGTVHSCVNVAMFSGVAAPSSVDVTGSNSGISTSLSATLGASTTQADSLLFANFGFSAPSGSGGVGVPPPFQPLNLRCDDSNTFCLIPGYRIVTATGVYAANATTGNSVTWGGVITAYHEGTTPVQLRNFSID